LLLSHDSEVLATSFQPLSTVSDGRGREHFVLSHSALAIQLVRRVRDDLRHGVVLASTVMSSGPRVALVFTFASVAGLTFASAA